MIKDFSSKEVVSSVLNKKLIKHYNNDYSFISLFGDFFITADRFLPICADYFCTSTDLFGFYEKPKYRHLLTEEFYNFLNVNSNIIEINNSFILGSTGNYYHDMIDCFSRIFSYNENLKYFKKINNIVISDITNHNILDEILLKLNINIPIIKLRKDKIYRFNKSIIPVNRNLKRAAHLYKKFFLTDTIIPKKNLFISRKDSKTRTIINEDEVFDVLKNKNFTCQTLSNKTLLEQINLFSSSKHIISMHGAGLTNLLFTQPISSLVEITANFKESQKDWLTEKNSEEFNNFTRSMFNRLALLSCVDHYYYFAKTILPSNETLNKISFEFQKFTFSNLKVDIDYFKKEIENIIN